jgi:ABC-2 type transport system ATP-binding protein
LNAAVETHGLGKRYGRVAALEDLSLRVSEGEVFGFLGPNGAGKTTTIRLLLGLLRPSAGRATVLGRAVGPGAPAARAGVGYLPGELALWPELTGRETLDILARLSGLAPARRAELLERLALTPEVLGRRVHTYSDGMKQKLGLVQAFETEPRLLLLDEPTKGLDPLVQQTFYTLIAEARGRGATVFFSSHVLSEVEVVCDRVAMLRTGRLVAVESVEAVRGAQRRRVTVILAPGGDASALARFGAVTRQAGDRTELLVAARDVPALVARLATLPLADLTIETPSLEDAFLEHYR